MHPIVDDLGTQVQYVAVVEQGWGLSLDEYSR
jgi:hypothetical protein